jgi:signal peptidase II
MTRLHRLGLVFLILMSCTSCDQAIKSIARESLASSPPISIFYGLVRVEYTENPGAILGLGADLPSEIRLLFFIIFVSVVLTLTLVFALNTHSLNLMQIAGLSLIAAGGIGNLLDRLFNNGLVVDYVSLGIGPLRTGIFNLADVAIFGGVAVFLLFGAKEQKAKSAP